MYFAFRTVVNRLWERNGNYDELTKALKDRKDCHLEQHDSGRFWCSAVDGAARLVIAPEWDGFLMYRVDENLSWIIPRIESVQEWLDAHKEWLDAHKEEQAKPAAKRVDCLQAVEDARKQWRDAPEGEADSYPLAVQATPRQMARVALGEASRLWVWPRRAAAQAVHRTRRRGP